MVGISAAGQVDTSGHIFHATGLLPGWAGVPLKREVEAHFGRPTAVLSDGHAAALGEAWYGAGRGRSSVLCLTVGTGVGGGMVVDGEVYRGAWGAAGIVGHTQVVRDGLPCTCGGQGCLESYVSGPALVREYNARVAGQPALTDGRAVVERARAGDPAAREALAAIGAWLGFGLASLLGALNPEVVVIGGGVSQAGDMLLESARESLRTYGFPTVKETPILPAVLGPQAGLVGAAVLAHQQKTR
ncbi:MAG: ROK family protein [Anaerolineae bacterium]|nr:ROK family protein [Anaerolineae bacterium]